MASLIGRCFGKDQDKIKIVVETPEKTETNYENIPENLSGQELTEYIGKTAKDQYKKYPKVNSLYVTDKKTFGIRIK